MKVDKSSVTLSTHREALFNLDVGPVQQSLAAGSKPDISSVTSKVTSLE